MLSVLLKQSAFILLITLVCLESTLGNNSTDGAIEKLEVKVYYETLCPDSIRFIRYQLYGAMITKKLLQYADLKFIPYGKVTKRIDPITNKVQLLCQHGQRECDKNALHACIVEHNTEFEQMQMIDCLLGRYTPSECSENLNINIDAALQCKETRTIEDILKIYGDQTPMDIWFVPSIAIGGIFERDIQNHILYHFLSVFCTKYKQKYNISPTYCAQ